MRWLFMSLIISLSSIAWNASAEFGSGGAPDLQKATSEASAQLNSAFASIHSMLAAVDVKDEVATERYRQESLRKLADAEAAYEKAIRFATRAKLVGFPKTEDDRLYMDYFRRFGADFGMPKDATQADAIIAAAKAVAELRRVLDVRSAKQMSVGVEHEEVARRVVKLENFLLGVTTALRLSR